ncbi:MAG: thioredoxin family protein [Methanosarcinaceae archaeon]|nr:thioredoxin family protein [Methanosarcinaceae archaeon]
MTLIELYHSDTCPNCHYVRAQLLEVLPRGVKFKEINTSSPDGAAHAKEMGILEVPTITIDGEIMFIGRVDKDEIEQEIKLHI